MTSLMFLLMFQYVISAKAGLVNFVQGQVNVEVAANVAEGEPIRTGSNSFAEVLLNPGSFIRMGENSEMIIESTDLTAVALRIVSGSAVLEAAGVDEENPIRVAVGEMELNVIDEGIYAIENNEVRILSGKVTMDLFNHPISKGLKLVPFNEVFKQVPLPKGDQPLSALEEWSQGRSQFVAMANFEMLSSPGANRLTRSPGQCMMMDCWIYSSRHNSFTFLPRRGFYVSPYGQTFRNAAYINRRNDREERNGVVNAGNANVNRPAPSSGRPAYNPANDRPTRREILRDKHQKIPATIGPPM